MSRLRGHKNSFGYAFEGMKTVLKQEANLQVHLGIAVLVLITAVLLHFSVIEWVILLFTISFVISLELVNTSLEAIVDLVSPKSHEKAKIAKDVSAAAVLVATIFSIIISIILFLPKILVLIY